MTKSEIQKIKVLLNKMHDEWPHFECEEEDGADTFREAFDELRELVHRSEMRPKRNSYASANASVRNTLRKKAV